MSQPPYQPYPPQEPYPGPPSSGAPQGYQQPGIPQQPPGYSAPPPSSGGGYTPPPPPGGSFPPPGQPGGGQYGTPQYGTPPPPKKKSSALKITLIVVAVIAVLCVGGIGVAFFAAKDKVSEVVDAAKISVSEPATLGGRAKVTDPTVAAGVNDLDRELASVPGATGSVGAVYGDVQKQDLVMVAAASTVSGSAQERFDEFTKGMASGGMKADQLTDTDPGPLGGIAKCGDTDSAGVKMAICVWSDNGSIGMFAMLFKSKADLEKEFVTMRGEVEKKA